MPPTLFLEAFGQFSRDTSLPGIVSEAEDLYKRFQRACRIDELGHHGERPPPGGTLGYERGRADRRDRRIPDRMGAGWIGRGRRARHLGAADAGPRLYVTPRTPAKRRRTTYGAAGVGPVLR